MLILFLNVLASFAQDSFTRLPASARPIHYTLDIRVFLENKTTHGEGVIYLEITQPTDNITLHSSKWLTIRQDMVNLVKVRNRQDLSWQEVPILSQSQELGPSEQHCIKLERQLKKGSHIWLRIPFKGKIKEGKEKKEQSGLYISPDGGISNVSSVAITHFEFTFARHVFPCFDEPHLKATFSLSIGRHRDEVSRSNAEPLVLGAKIQGSDEYVLDHFNPTPIMSTYILAIMVSRLGYSEAFSQRGVRFCSWYSKDQGHKWANKFTKNSVKIMDHLQETVFKGVLYPLKKMDQVFVTNLVFSAMENWGIITYKLSSPQSYMKSEVFGEGGTFGADYMIAHELAHQWHGNLVTHAWWKEWWLTEGFATYFQEFGLRALYPKKFIRQMLVTKKGQYGAFLKDTFKALPMVLNESGNFTAFMDMNTNSYLFYNRGASIITMLAGMIGQETFLTGVRKYLKSLAYSTAVTEDLWTQLEHEARASGFFTNLKAQSIKEIMDPWVVRAGYPILTISRNYSSGRVTISQSTLICQEDFICKTFQPENLWHVWMTYYTPGAGISGAKMLEPTATQELDLFPAEIDEALLCNRGQEGYFRVRYDDQNILKVAELMMNNHTALDPVERAQFILDTSPIPGLLMTPPGLATLLSPECNTNGVAIWWKMMGYLKKKGIICL